MNVTELRASVAGSEPPRGLTLPVQALWWAAKGDWHQAHKLAQQAEDKSSAWVHAHLHRIEGDLSNAGHWYARAGKPADPGTLDAEWDAIAKALL
jgi:hypothetical protein